MALGSSTSEAPERYTTPPRPRYTSATDKAPLLPAFITKRKKYALHKGQVDLRGRRKANPAVEVKAFWRDEGS